jgi:ATP-dependent protease ClpP protease subunit
MKRAEFKCQNREAEVWLYDVIGTDFWGEGISAYQFQQDLGALEDIDRLTVRINSPGGLIFDGNAIYNALWRFPAEVVAVIDGVAASAASLVAMAGDRITMAENAMMMVHQPHAHADGTAEDHRKLADLLDKTLDGLVIAYSNKSGASRATVKAWLDEETWFTSAEAVEAGLADEVTGALKLAACIPPGIYDKTPKEWEIAETAEAGARTPNSPAEEAASKPPVAPQKRLEAELTLIGP